MQIMNYSQYSCYEDAMAALATRPPANTSTPLRSFKKQFAPRLLIELVRFALYVTAMHFVPSDPRSSLYFSQASIHDFIV